MKCALIYDFDGTLAEGDCAQHGVMPELEITDIPEFWASVKRRAKDDDGDEILTYLGMLAERARMLKSDVLSTEKLMMHGQSIPLFSGVESWFDRIDRFAESIDLELEHYIISSGLDAMIRGTREFR